MIKKPTERSKKQTNIFDEKKTHQNWSNIRACDNIRVAAFNRDWA